MATFLILLLENSVTMKCAYAVFSDFVEVILKILDRLGKDKNRKPVATELALPIKM